MSYYTVLGFQKEPFSTSPDPDFFYQSYEHKAALTNILIEIRLKRGLSVILGDVGIGKTTLSRKLFQLLSVRENICEYMILDPSYDSEYMFLLSLMRTFGIKIGSENPSSLDIKEALKRFLFQKGVNENKTVVLLVDEAQKLNSMSLELLRMLLNYETNEYKLLQLIIMSQMELLPRIKKINNFYDRITLKYIINPLDENETRKMIDYRLHEAGLAEGKSLFTPEAIKRIFNYTQGYPRRIAVLCHNSLTELIIAEKNIVDEEIVKKVIERDEI